MSRNVYRYAFTDAVPTDEIETTILLAIIAAESIHGETQVRLDFSHTFDAKHRSCVIDADSPVGRDVNKLLAGFLSKEFGRDSFRVERMQAIQPEPVA